MNFQMNGDGVTVTPALREYMLQKLDRVTRHFDKVVTIAVILRYNPHRDESHRHTVTIDLSVKGHGIHVEHTNGNMYATIDQTVDSLERSVQSYKNRTQDHRHIALKRMAA
jgi:putative sigma-54 modulation protein